MKIFSALIQEQIDFFHENGYLGPIKVYEPEEAKRLLNEIRKKSFDRSNSVFNNDVNYDRHFDVSELTQHFGHPNIVGRIRSLLGPDILGWRTEFHPKFPGSTGTEWHQVKTYQFSSGKPQVMPTKEVLGEPYDLTVWTTFTEATKENGCMKFIPGSHKRLYYDEKKPTLHAVEGHYKSVDSGTDFYGYRYADYKIDPNWNPDDEKIVALEMQPGECVFFSALCVHGSYPNTTKRSTRFAVSCRYVPTHTKVYPDQENFESHGSHFDLKRYATVLLAGADTYQHNKITTQNFMGEDFPYCPAQDNILLDVNNEIIALWKKVLSLDENENIECRENFFDLGGHSLHLTELQNAFKNKFFVELDIVDLFEHPTVESLAQHISSKMA